MTYHMEYDIQIGNFKVQTLKSVRVIKSVSQLSDPLILNCQER